MPLCNHSCYSLKYAVQKPKELIQRATNEGYSAIALTDINNTSGCWDFLRLSKDGDLHTVIGIDFRDVIKPLYIGLAKSNEGFRQLNDHLSKHLTQDHLRKCISFTLWIKLRQEHLKTTSILVSAHKSSIV